MTKIGGAQRGMNTVLDQIISQANVQNAAATKDREQNTAFNSHLLSFDNDTDQEQTPAGVNAGASDKAAPRMPGQTPANTVATLFDSLLGDQPSQRLATNAALQEEGGAGVAETFAAQQPNDNVSSLFAALAGTQTGDTDIAGGLTPHALNGVNGASPMVPGGTATAGKPSDALSALLAAAASDDQTLGAEPISNLAAAKPTAIPVTDNKSSLTMKASSKAVGAPSTDHSAPASSASADLSPLTLTAAAQAAFSMLPVPQAHNPIAASASPRKMPVPGQGTSNAGLSGTSAAALPSSIAEPSADVSNQAALSGPGIPQREAAPPSARDPSALVSETGDRFPQTITMQASAIQAQTHFAPVQQLSPSDPFAGITPVSEASVPGAGAASQQPGKSQAASALAGPALSPVEQLSPANQIAGFIASNLPAGGASDANASPSPANASDAAAQPAPAAPASMAPVKTLTLALEPDNLGTVTIRLRLADSGLEVMVQAANPETAAMIDQDKASLSDKLKSLGYTVDALVVQNVAAQGSHLAASHDQSTGQGQGQGQGQQQTAADAGASNLSQNGGSGAHDQLPAQRRRETANGLEEPAPNSAGNGNIGDGLYV